MQCVGEIVGLLKERASQLEVIAHPSSTFCSLLNAWPATNSLLLAQCFEASHKGDLQNLQTSFPPTLSWRENDCFSSWDLIKTNSFCPSSSVHQKNTTDKAVSLVSKHWLNVKSLLDSRLWETSPVGSECHCIICTGATCAVPWHHLFVAEIHT